MIHYTTGNILDSEAYALVNTVNTIGAMGKGVALQFKKAFPNNFKAYHDACKRKEVKIGKMFVTEDSNLNSGKKIIVNFPTKDDWRKPSEYSFIETGLDDLLKVIDLYQIKSIALPPLGAGNGGLEWEKVKRMIIQKLSVLQTDIFIYEPTKAIKEYLKTERVKLTEARALLLYVLYDLVRNGEFVSEFSSEKVCYFLQKFGGGKYLKLNFEPNFYGPYSGKVRYVLNYLNGSYLTGYSDMNKKPFDPLMLVSDGYETVKSYIENNAELTAITAKTTAFLNGFYSDFSLELLSSVDYIVNENNTFDKQIITQKLSEWNDRKRSMFSNQEYYIDLITDYLQKQNNEQETAYK
jgi:O-acetyl-ADP-ribose deacetylase (regulator of RNase III)